MNRAQMASAALVKCVRGMIAGSYLEQDEAVHQKSIKKNGAAT